MPMKYIGARFLRVTADSRAKGLSLGNPKKVTPPREKGIVDWGQCVGQCGNPSRLQFPPRLRQVAQNAGSRLDSRMSAREIISEIQRLPLAEQAKVIQFAYQLDAERMLSGKELGGLAQRMIDATDPVEKLRIREELTRGFYGGNSDA